MIVSTQIMGLEVKAHIDAEGYEMSLFEWSGRRNDPAEIDYLIKFLQAVQMGVKAFHAVTVSPNEAQPQSSSIRDAVEEAIAEEEAPAPELTEPATEEDFAYQSSDSGDMFDDYYEESDYSSGYAEQSLSRWVVKAKNGHVAIGEGILTKYPGEDWGEASGWSELSINLNDLYPDFKRRVLKFVKDLPPGVYDLPYHFDEDEEDEDEDNAIDGTITTNGPTPEDEPKPSF